jgi:carbon monoxide dehydrogenase subunit G
VGAISAAFGGTATLTDLEPPTRLAARLNGEDKSVASIVQGTFASTLRAVPGGTEVNYQMDVSLRGRLAQFGTAAVNSTARKMTAEFTARLREVLVNGTAPSEPGPPSDPGRTEADRTAGE